MCLPTSSFFYRRYVCAAALVDLRSYLSRVNCWFSPAFTSICAVYKKFRGVGALAAGCGSLVVFATMDGNGSADFNADKPLPNVPPNDEKKSEKPRGVLRSLLGGDRKEGINYGKT